MRVSPDRYPEEIDFTCEGCWSDNASARVTGIDPGGVWIICPECETEDFLNLEG